MPDLTILTPIAPHHLSLFAFAHASVKAQTVACTHLWAVDGDGKGAGYVRNRLLEKVTTPYVSFLDADDWLEPTFAEETLAAIRRRQSVYIYTDWLQDGQHIPAPDCAWTGGTHHLVSAVVPTEWIRAVGGFDESMVGLEDTELYVKLVTGGYTCCRLPRPLVHYRPGGGRAEAVHRNQKLLNELNALIRQRYGEKQVSCCGEPQEPNLAPIGQKQEGDVLGQALWGGNREEFGRSTGRRYPRMSYPKMVWMNRADIQASPHLWGEVAQTPPSQQITPLSPVAVRVEATDRPKGLAALEQRMIQAGLVRAPQAPPRSYSIPNPQSAPAGVRAARLPNVAKIKRLASVAYGKTDWPLFVMPRLHYPSYNDFWRLVELSGFEAIYQDEADLSDSRQTFIFAAPDSIPDCSQAKARTILWQLEYAGEYTQQTNGETVREIWSSDPAHAKRTGAKYVLLGSHRGLNPALERGSEFDYDLTLLGYMVDRRRAIKDQLSQYRWSPDYPGHNGAERHRVLSRTRLMLHVHQHETSALTPLRFALAAAYKMPVVSEMVEDCGVYANYAVFTPYNRLAEFVRGNLAQDDVWMHGALYDLLCVKNPFDKGVWGGLKA